MPTKVRTGFTATDVAADIVASKATRLRVEVLNNDLTNVVYMEYGADAVASNEYIVIGPGRVFTDDLPPQSKISLITDAGVSVTGCVIETLR